MTTQKIMIDKKLLRFISYECRMYKDIMEETPDKSSWSPDHQAKVMALIADIMEAI